MEKKSEGHYGGVGTGGSMTGLSVTGAIPEDERSSCFCFESDDDSSEKIRLKYTKRKLARGCLSNMTLCLILIGYTFLGAIIFLAIEGGSLFYSLTRKDGGLAYASKSPRFNSTSLLERLGEESRVKAVDNIWEITVSLNILYKDNWTRLAAQEISRFQESLVKHITEEISFHSTTANEVKQADRMEWTLGRAFLYSLTILTTIGYGNLAPRTGLGKAVTMGYAALGIPLVLLYLSSVGSLLSSCARNIFTRSLCCCLCSNCGYCCYDEKRMQEKERRMRRKRERREYEQRMQTLRSQEPFYVRSASAYTTSTTNNLLTTQDAKPTAKSFLDTDCLSNESFVESKAGNFLAPFSLCLIIMTIYIGGGALLLYNLEHTWTYFECVFFCFMILSTIGFGESMPGDSGLSGRSPRPRTLTEELTVWFCSFYILSGLALTSMCFNVVHEEIGQRLRRHYVIVSSNNVARTKDNSVISFKLRSTGEAGVTTEDSTS